MKVIILGCGSSSGVPIIGCVCMICKSNNPYNNRLRSSILIQDEETNILVDTSPDLRYQALRSNINYINAVFYTHAHADHIAGIDDLRAFNFIQKEKIPIYSDRQTLDYLQKSYNYIFKENIEPNWYKTSLESNIIKNGDVINIGKINIEIFEQIHGKIKSLGLKINNKIAYSTDVKYLPETSINLLKNIDIWIVDCLSEAESVSHANLDQILKWISIIKPKTTILTHMNHTIDYGILSKNLPDNVYLAYDKMEIICNN